jgi:hypothetical protein
VDFILNSDEIININYTPVDSKRRFKRSVYCMVEKISTPLIKFKELVLKFHVSLVKVTNDRRDNVFNVYTFDNKSYGILDTNAYLTLEIIKNKDESWDKTKSVIISEKNIHKIVSTIKTMIDILYNNETDLFYTRNNEIFLYNDIGSKFIKEIELGAGKLTLQPGIVYDMDERSYEGCVILFNKINNIVGLSIDELEALYHILNKVDIFAYKMSMLTYYNTIKDIDIKVINNQPKVTKSIFIQEEDKERMLGTIIEKKDEFDMEEI